MRVINIAALMVLYVLLTCCPSFCASGDSKNINLNVRLFKAVMSDDLRTVKELVRSGANVNTQNAKGSTPIFDAVRYRSVELVRMLISLGATIQISDQYGNTPLLSAAGSHNRCEVIDILLAHGADINAKNHLGDTPLHQTIHGNQIVNAQHLIGKGADVNQRNKKGQTPLMLAATIGDKKFIQLFQKSGARSNYNPGYSIKHSNGDESKIIYKTPNIPQYITFPTGYRKSIQTKRTAKSECEILDWAVNRHILEAYHCFWTEKPQRKWVVLVTDTGSGAYVLQAFIYLSAPNKAAPYELLCVADIGTFSNASTLGGAYINPKKKTLIMHNSDGKTIKTVKLPDFDKWVHL